MSLNVTTCMVVKTVANSQLKYHVVFVGMFITPPGCSLVKTTDLSVGFY